MGGGKRCEDGFASPLRNSKNVARSFLEGTAMQDRVIGESLSVRGLVFISPCVEQCIGIREKESRLRYLCPFTIEQSGAHVADMTKADARYLRQLGDAPSTLRIVHQYAQDLR